METSISLAAKDQCTGCGACKAICLKGAVSFFPDEEGFPSPIIDRDACVRCGLCEKICPALHQPETHSILEAYAVQIKDKDALRESTSGGVFTALSREIFRRGGVIFGCVWDEQYHAIIRKAETEEEMKPMRGSKYVWSWAGDAFPEIKAYLDRGRTVLFTGLPCQVAGLIAYLRKPYQNLITMDFLCSGAPSPMAFRSYLKTICPDEKLSDLVLKFRDKDPYGVGVHITYHGQKKMGKKTGQHIANSYYYSFYTRLIDRLSCYHCHYRTGERVSDITMGDYWGVAQFHQEFDIPAGVSALLINSDKGKELLDAVKDGLELSETRVESIAVGNNLSLDGEWNGFPIPKFRSEFFNTLKSQGWRVAERRFLYNSTRLKLWIRQKIPNNYAMKLRKMLRGR